MTSRLPLALLMLALSAACAESNPGTTPPKDQFHFPVSVAVVQPAGSWGTLYVANSNFDLRYNRGTVAGIDLARLDAALGTSPALQVVPLAAVTDANGVALIGSFAGRIVAYQASDTGSAATLFVPARENNALYALRADGLQIDCFDAPGERDCLDHRITLKATEDVQAQGPFGARVVKGETAPGGGTRDSLYVTHLTRSPSGDSYVVRVDPQQPGKDTFYRPIGSAPSDDATDVQLPGSAGRTLFLTGRCTNSSCSDAAALRAAPLPAESNASLDAQFTESTEVEESRAIAASSQQDRLFLATRGPIASVSTLGTGPDGLAIIDLAGFSAASPRLGPSGFVSLPQCGTSALLPIPAWGAGARDLVAIACSQENSLLFYDDARGELVAGILNPPETTWLQQPFGFALAVNPSDVQRKRLFVANFGGLSTGEAVGSVAILDIDGPGKRPVLRGIVR